MAREDGTLGRLTWAALACLFAAVPFSCDGRRPKTIAPAPTDGQAQVHQLASAPVRVAYGSFRIEIIHVEPARNKSAVLFSFERAFVFTGSPVDDMVLLGGESTSALGTGRWWSYSAHSVSSSEAVRVFVDVESPTSMQHSFCLELVAGKPSAEAWVIDERGDDILVVSAIPSAVAGNSAPRE